MAMTRHPHNDAGKATTLLIVLSLSLCVIISLDAQEKTVHPNDFACPVTADLSPAQVRSGDSIKSIFPKDAIPSRVSISMLHPENKDVYVEYSWIGNRQVWGTYSGLFFVKGDGKPNCFFLSDAGIPGSVPCKEFSLKIPKGVRVKEITFSSLPSEKPVVLCPMPKLEQDITDAYVDCRQNPEDKEKALVLIRLLERTTSEYDCRRPFDSEPVPAWWLVSYEVYEGWIMWLYRKVSEKNGDAFRVLAKFFATSDGHIAEIMSEQMWGILHDQPLLILENWTGIEDNKKWVLMCRPWPSQGGSPLISEMIEIYSDIARKEPKYKPACDEIISILNKKCQDMITHNLLHRRYTGGEVYLEPGELSGPLIQPISPSLSWIIQ